MAVENHLATHGTVCTGHIQLSVVVESLKHDAWMSSPLGPLTSRLLYALEHAGQVCRDDKDVVLAAVQGSGCALRYASQACREDRDIVRPEMQVEDGRMIGGCEDAHPRKKKRISEKV